MHFCPQGFYHAAEDEKENEGKKSYFRVYSCDCSEDDVIDKLRDMMDKVFHNMSMRVVIETPKPEEDSAVAETVASLKEFGNLHFATQ